ncbi:hypothetical protein SAMN05421759_12012 [Roseivivax lentus]|uniref:VanZ like family protein n=1 Tax=Roseivivax lentus TaxID=633194 RepID=A0A1N7PTM3_9RHOB|nr:hypothetical protein [Roseivivax lentus]SIT13958.1 hypothetical protein SAMN05421759_12012 [Roseivivax lentus]
MDSLAALKGEIAFLVGIDNNWLHILLGVLIFGAVAFLFRHARTPFAIAFCATGFLQLANEMSDGMQQITRSGQISFGEAVSDTVLTLALPAVFLLIMKTRHSIPRRASPLSVPVAVLENQD